MLGAMTKKLKKCGICFVVVVFVYAITAQDKAQSIGETKALRVLQKASAAVGNRKTTHQLISFRIRWQRLRVLFVGDNRIRQKQAFDTSFVPPTTIRQGVESIHLGVRQVENYRLNGNNFYHEIDVFGNGGIRQNSLPSIDKKILQADLRYSVFLLVFPITLDSSWYMPLKFRFVGVAESDKDGRANVIEAVSQGKTTYRLFFDVEMHLLRLMTQTWETKDKKRHERKYFFSDYKKKNDLLVATKVVVQQEGQVLEEREIKDLEVNPKFEPDWFK